MTRPAPRARAVDARRDLRRWQWPGSKRPASTTFASWSIASSPISRTHCRSAASSGEVELVREGATLLMLAMTGMLAGRTWRARLGYAAIAFGFWDILYYVFLRIMSGWPASPVRLGHSLSAAAAVVGAGARAGLYRVTDDRVGHPRHPMAGPHPGDSFHAGLVGCEWGRHPARAGGLHGRFDSCPARRARHGSSGAADGVQLAGVRRGAAAHGHAVGAHRLASRLSGRHRLRPRQAIAVEPHRAIYFFRVALMSASMWSRYFSNARRPAALSRYSVRGVRPANVFSHST